MLSVMTSKIEGLGATVTGVLTAGIIGLQAIADPIAQLTGLAAPDAPCPRRSSGRSQPGALMKSETMTTSERRLIA